MTIDEILEASKMIILDHQNELDRAFYMATKRIIGTIDTEQSPAEFNRIFHDDAWDLYA
jgi:hypothetical protein